MYFFQKYGLTNGAVRVNIIGRAREKSAHTAMMREIAPEGGNFRGVCPVIGRLSDPVRAGVYRRRQEGPALRRPFFMVRSDTHGGVNKKMLIRTQDPKN